MSKNVARTVGAAVMLALVACREAPPPPLASIDSVVALSAPTEVPHEFTWIGRPAELPDGRLVTYDQKDGGLLLVDPFKGSVEPISRPGSGPFEYGPVGFVLPGADTVGFYDMTQQRVMLIGPSGAPVRTVSFADAPKEVMELQPMAVDGASNIYGYVSVMATETVKMDSKGHVLSSHVEPKPPAPWPIQRFDVRSKRLTTMLHWPMGPAERQKEEPLANGVRITLPAPSFQPRFSWAIMTNGRIAMFANGEYRARFVGQRDTVVGPAIPFTPIPVTDAERKAAGDSEIALRRTMRPAADTTHREYVFGKPSDGATHKPPYGELYSTPANMLWVQTPTPGVGGPGRFDVLDSTGRRLLTVTLPAGEQLVCVGRKAVYTSRKDADDFYYIRKYTLPTAISR